MVEIPLNDSKEILIVDAYINWIKETNKTEQKVNLSLSSPYLKKLISQQLELVFT